MKARYAAALVLALGLTVGVSGCGLATPQATLQHYEPSDGVSVDVGEVHIRNFFVVVGTDEYASLVFSAANTSSEPVDLQVSLGGSARKTLPIPANTTVIFGGDVPTEHTYPAPVIQGFKVKAGELFPVFFQYGTFEGRTLKAPVLDGGLYPKLLPVKPTTTPTASTTQGSAAIATPIPDGSGSATGSAGAEPAPSATTPAG